MADKVIEKSKINIAKQTQALVEGEAVLFSCESLVFALDVSGSMSGIKLMTLQRSFRKYIINRISNALSDKDTTAVVLFPSYHHNSEDYEVEILFPLQQASLHMADKLDDTSSRGNTPMYDALRASADVLAGGALGLARIILMTDGEPNGRYDKPEIIHLAQHLFQTEGFIIDTVGICNLHDGMGDMSEFDEQFLKQVAEAGGGCFVKITSSDDFDKFLTTVEAERRIALGHGILMLGDGKDNNVQ